MNIGTGLEYESEGNPVRTEQETTGTDGHHFLQHCYDSNFIMKELH